MSPVLLEVHDLKKHFPLRGGLLRPGGRRVYAVDGVSFQIDKAETLALVGESGCGKSTVGRAILRLFDITAGQVVLDGKRIDDMPAGALRPLRRRMQVVFQDPVSSLNPRMACAISSPSRSSISPWRNRPPPRASPGSTRRAI
jgi:peptide/nickel transport system ATP-binding protein